VLKSYALGKLVERASTPVAAITVNHGIGNAETMHKRPPEKKLNKLQTVTGISKSGSSISFSFSNIRGESPWPKATHITLKPEK
jgi:hypothetical protein